MLLLLRQGDHYKLFTKVRKWREVMNFMFEWQEQNFASECCEPMIYCSRHENIIFKSTG